MGKSKACGRQAARKLRVAHRNNLWASSAYRKRQGTSIYKTPLEGVAMASGIVTGRVAVEAKQPNSAIRKAVRVQLKKNSKTVTAFVPRDGALKLIDENDRVLIAGMGRSGRSVGDLPGVRFKVIKVAGYSLLALWLGKKEKPHS
jgi:small subunit ribosomal protein S23e